MWKSNWEETQQRFKEWWNHDGLLVGMWGAPSLSGSPHELVEKPTAPKDVPDAYLNYELRAWRNHHQLSREDFPAEILPLPETHLGPGSLALFLGAEPGFSEDTVWYEPSLMDCDELDEVPPFRFDASNKWWQLTEKTLRASVELGRGKYLVGCPDLIENVDILAALRDPQTFLLDMIEEPEWVEEKVREINQVWFEAYDRIYQIIKEEDGSAAFEAFRIWGPGKTAKLQCDASAMFSPQMYQRFVIPSLTEQCQWLDYSLYHLDGTQAMCHLEALLGIEALDAIEWTPQAGIEEGGNPRWYDLYRRILDAGKSLQVVGVKKHEIAPLLDAIGSKGVYILTDFKTPGDAEEIDRIIKPYR